MIKRVKEWNGLHNTKCSLQSNSADKSGDDNVDQEGESNSANKSEDGNVGHEAGRSSADKGEVEVDLRNHNSFRKRQLCTVLLCSLLTWHVQL